MEEALKAIAVLTGYRYTMDPDFCVLGEKWIPRATKNFAAQDHFQGVAAGEFGSPSDHRDRRRGVRPAPVGVRPCHLIVSTDRDRLPIKTQ
jgi:hypothetical protein